MWQLKAAFQAGSQTVRERPLAAAIRGWAGGISKIVAGWFWGWLGVRQLNVQITQPPSALQE